MEMRTTPDQKAAPLHNGMQSPFMGSSHFKPPSDEVSLSPPAPAGPKNFLDLGVLSIHEPADVAADMASSSPDARLSEYSMTDDRQACDRARCIS